MKSITLICIPFAGGTSVAFRDVTKYLPSHITPNFIDFPGHGRRLQEPLVSDIHDLVSDIFHKLPTDENSQLIIWGHSMGGTIAYLLTRRLLRAGRQMPLHLFVSGSPAPSIPRKEKDVYKLPRHALVEKVKKYGGVVEEVLAEKDLMDMFLPILRADFQALETYEYTPIFPPLTVPITAMVGSGEHIKEEDILDWQKETTLPLIIKKLEGNHFFIFDHLELICQMVVNSLNNHNSFTNPNTNFKGEKR
ncbi:MAG: thioesterase [Desulfamplus sp.]|nr:thioesterase [Desulfamplus sp.]